MHNELLMNFCRTLDRSPIRCGDIRVPKRPTMVKDGAAAFHRQPASSAAWQANSEKTKSASGWKSSSRRLLPVPCSLSLDGRGPG